MSGPPRLHLDKIRELTLRAGSLPGRSPYLSAASGLVRVGDFLYVVADDELHLGVFSVDPETPGELIRLLPGDLPETIIERKALKPDLEALVLLPPFGGHPHGALFALGSGSKRNRRTGVLLGLDARGALRGTPRPVDLTAMMDSAKDEFKKLNFEGAVIAGDRFLLLQRGNKGKSGNALFASPLAAVLRALERGEAPDDSLQMIRGDIDLGAIHGVPLCFSDAAALPDGDLVFTAIAEDTEDSYADGPFAGAAVGVMSHKGKLKMLRRLEPGYKVEGIDTRVASGKLHLLLVTDADDERVPASLYSAEIDGYPFSGSWAPG